MIEALLVSLKLVSLKGVKEESSVGFAEVALRERVKQAGGKWNPRQKVWELCYGHVVALNLEARIVEYEATTSRDQD